MTVAADIELGDFIAMISTLRVPEGMTDHLYPESNPRAEASFSREYILWNSKKRLIGNKVGTYPSRKDRTRSTGAEVQVLVFDAGVPLSRFCGCTTSRVIKTFATCIRADRSSMSKLLYSL